MYLCCQARNDTWSTFIGDVNSWIGTVSVVVYRLRIRTVDEITREAENLVREQFAAGKYNFLAQNCQHFASYCCTGQQISLDAEGNRRKIFVVMKVADDKDDSNLIIQLGALTAIRSF